MSPEGLLCVESSSYSGPFARKRHREKESVSSKKHRSQGATGLMEHSGGAVLTAAEGRPVTSLAQPGCGTGGR